MSSNNLYLTLVRKVTSRLMIHGKRAKAESILGQALLKVEKEHREKRGGLPRAFLLTISRVCPALEVKSVRRGGGIFQVPFPVSKNRQIYMGLSWLIKGARTRRKKCYSLEKALTLEILDTCKGKSWSLGQRKSMHRKAIANKAFKHFRW